MLELPEIRKGRADKRKDQVPVLRVPCACKAKAENNSQGQGKIVLLNVLMFWSSETMIARIEIECRNPELVLNAIKPETDKKFDIKFKTSKNKIVMRVEADDIPDLLAGINSYLRLIRTAMETSKIE